MAKNNTAPSLKGFDDLFAPSVQIDPNKSIDSVKLSLVKLKPFDKHPFKGYNAEKLQGLAQSIKEQGIIVPILVRPIEHKDFDYEIVAGHNRVQASMLAGLNDIPCYVRELDDETATILMVDSNLQQRETILPSEKAFAYKYKLEAIKSRGKRTDLTCDQLGHKLNGVKSVEIIAENADDSRNQIVTGKLKWITYGKQNSLVSK